MFNEYCFGVVINELFVEEFGIVVGNLWYYFKIKRDLLEEFNVWFVEDVDVWFFI